MDQNLTKEELAAQYHERGYGCAQSVLASFAGDYGLDEGLALRMATGFGSGMGRLCEVCGALTGAFMVIGLKYGKEKSMAPVTAARLRRLTGSLPMRPLNSKTGMAPSTAAN